MLASLLLLSQKIDLSGFFFFQAEDGIRDADVTGVQTCALPISRACPRGPARARPARRTRLAAAGPRWWAVTAARSVPADPYGARERHRVRALAKIGRAHV